MKRKKIKDKKKKQKLTKKQIVILIIVTIVLGIFCYFMSTEITKSIIDHKTMNEKKEKDEYNDLKELDKVENINLETLINNYNELTSDEMKVNFDEINDNKIIIDDIEFSFVISNNNLSITSINFNKKNKKIKEVISNMIIANNENINEATTELVYDRVFETLGNTSDEESKTSEFFQYQGLEFSLKEFKDNDYKYSFRIGRITEEN